MNNMLVKFCQIAFVLGAMLFAEQQAFASWNGKSETYDWYSNSDTTVGETEDNPYKISSETDLAGLANLISGSVANSGPHPNNFEGKYFILTKDLDFSHPNGKKNVWSPIGDKKSPFRGFFDGKGHTISNLNIGSDCSEKKVDQINVYTEYSKQTQNDLTEKFEYNECNDLGLFGRLTYAKVSNLTLKNLTINGNYIIGGICATAAHGTVISNCKVEGNVKGNGFVGGVCGFAETECVIDHCSFAGSLNCTKGKLAAGGICGIAQMKCSIKDCENTAKIDCEDTDYVGGVCGLINLYCSIDRCANSGAITINSTASGNMASFGGISGVVGHSCSLTEAVNIGDINATSNQGFVGGICGMGSEETSITISFNAGNITTSNGCVSGGICGMSFRNEINNCINVGNLSGSVARGGIVGYNYKNRGHVARCYFDKQTCPLTDGVGATEASSDKGNSNGTEKLSTTAMTSNISALNQGKWKFGEGYPKVKALAESEITKIAAQPIILQENETVNAVASPFNVTTNNGIEWKAESGNMTIAEEGKAKMDGETLKLTLGNGEMKRNVTLKAGK